MGNAARLPGVRVILSLHAMPPNPRSEEEPSSVEEKDRLNQQSIALMARVAAGDSEAFSTLVGLHERAVIGTCAKMLGNVDDAHDLAQQVFLRVWKSAARYQPTARFTTWLFTITRNLVFNHMRSAQRATFVSLDAENNSEAARQLKRAVATTSTPDAAALEAELRDAIDESIALLPDNQRLAVVLRRYENLSYEEIAGILETSVPAIKSLLFRARGQLRESLKPYLDPEQ